MYDVIVTKLTKEPYKRPLFIKTLKNLRVVLRFIRERGFLKLKFILAY